MAVVLPSFMATRAATTFREYAMASSNVIQPIPLRSALPTSARPLSSLNVAVSRSLVFMVTTPSWRAAVAVSILNTDPGS